LRALAAPGGGARGALHLRHARGGGGAHRPLRRGGLPEVHPVPDRGDGRARPADRALRKGDPAAPRGLRASRHESTSAGFLRDAGTDDARLGYCSPFRTTTASGPSSPWNWSESTHWPFSVTTISEPSHVVPPSGAQLRYLPIRCSSVIPHWIPPACFIST